MTYWLLLQIKRPAWLQLSGSESPRSSIPCLSQESSHLQTTGNYLGCVLKGGQQWLSDAQKETVLKILVSTTARQGREFLGTVGFWHLWIPGFAELAKSLYEATVSLRKPNKVAIIHSPGHQKGNELIPRGNSLADKTAWEVVVQTDLVLDTVQVEPGCPALPETPKYSQEDLTWIKSLPMTQCLEGGGAQLIVKSYYLTNWDRDCSKMPIALLIWGSAECKTY